MCEKNNWLVLKLDVTRDVDQNAQCGVLGCKYILMILIIKSHM